MALSIKDPEVDQMARRLARERQTTMTGAIKLALGNELNRGGVSPEERAKRRQSIRDRKLIGRLATMKSSAMVKMDCQFEASA
jgi:hypothetical protein